MKRLICVFLALGLMVSANAQQQRESPSMMDRAVSASIAVAKNIWERLQKEGRPLAEKMLKAAPEYYKGAQQQLQDFMKKVEKSDAAKSASEKQKLALELWKLRGAINVMALSDPEVVRTLLKMPPASVQKMQKDLKQTETKLRKANVPGI